MRARILFFSRIPYLADCEPTKHFTVDTVSIRKAIILQRNEKITSNGLGIIVSGEFYDNGWPKAMLRWINAVTPLWMRSEIAKAIIQC